MRAIRLCRVSAVLIWAGMLTVSACSRTQSEIPRVAVAASLYPAADSILSLYEAKSEFRPQLISASSGALTTQILQGAPIDIFLSADTAYPEKLFRRGCVIAGPDRFSRGRLILLSARIETALSLNMLRRTDIRKIAIANPETAPYGTAAMEVLEALGWTDSLRAKLVFAENVSQCNSFILSGNVDIGFTAQSVLSARGVPASVRSLRIPDSLYSPIDQSAVLIRRAGPPSETVASLYQYFFSDTAALVFRHFGYEVPERVKP